MAHFDRNKYLLFRGQDTLCTFNELTFPHPFAISYSTPVQPIPPGPIPVRTNHLPTAPLMRP